MTRRVLTDDLWAQVWWFISPRGKVEFRNLVTFVNPHQKARDGKDDVSKDWKGNPQEWAMVLAPRILSFGFKGIGAWSHPALHATGVPMSRDLNVLVVIRLTRTVDAEGRVVVHGVMLATDGPNVSQFIRSPMCDVREVMRV